MTKSTQEQILYALKSRGSLTAQMLADQLAISSQAAQQHLAKLSEQTLITPEDRTQGRGRPNRYWSLSDKGHARFPDRHSDLTVEILLSVEAAFGADGLEKLIATREANMLATYQARLAKHTSLAEKIAALAKQRNQEGYMAEWHKTDDGNFLLTENHCPICAAAKKCQKLCRSELALFQKILEGYAHIERTDHILSGARRCAYSIKPV